MLSSVFPILCHSSPVFEWAQPADPFRLQSTNDACKVAYSFSVKMCLQLWIHISICLLIFEVNKGLFIWRWAGPVRRATECEILPSLSNSYKNINVFIWEVSQPAQVGSHLILPGSHLGEMKIFHMNTRKWASPARCDRVFINKLCFAFQMLIK